tara:strand:+ start:105 stop:293 length:189 start_codon:yes stop_codon:yes gene_type:complete
MKYILRVLALPFWLIIALIYMLYELITKAILFVRYGGEIITYSTDDKITIFDIYQELRNDKL